MDNYNIPEELKALNGWLVWKYEEQPNGKRIKVPYYVNGSKRFGEQGGKQDRARLSTFNLAVKVADHLCFAGIGLALLPEFNISALDFDNCVTDGHINPDVENLVSCTYAEISPSGKGIRAFFKGNLGNHKSFDAPFGFETFNSKGFVTVTADFLPICELLGTNDTISTVTPEVEKLCKLRFKSDGFSWEDDDDPLMTFEPALGLTTAEMEDYLSVIDSSLGYQDWINIGMAIHHETDGEGFELWHEWSINSEKYPGEEALRKHWDSFGRNKGRPVTAKLLVKMANENSGSHFDSDIATIDEFDTLSDETPKKKAPKFPIVHAADFSEGPSPSWVIKGLIPKAELVVLFGASGAGKSFVALDMAMSITTGTSWRDLKTKQGRVVYIAAEGGGDFRSRVKAYAIHHQMDLKGVPLDIIPAAPNFLLGSDAKDVAKSIADTGGASVIIVDTFSQTVPGANENSAEHISKALAHCKGIHRATGAVIILIHHAGKDTSKGARGWSGLRAAADAEIEVIRTETDNRYIKVTKQKGAADNGMWGFDLAITPIGMDEDGDVIDSCVCVEAEVKEHTPRVKRGRWELLVIDVMAEISLSQKAGIDVEGVINEAIERADPVEKGVPDRRKEYIKRAVKKLCNGENALYLEEDGCLEVLV